MPAMPSEKWHFPNARGERLAGRLDLPDGEPLAYALFAHCFTCSKDSVATARIARALALQGVAVLRLDFTGLGESEGEFADSNFSGNVDDLRCAADELRRVAQAPALLIGHSLGGAAVLAAASGIPEARLVSTINAPSDARHLDRLLGDGLEAIEREGEAELCLGGRPFRIRLQFLEDLRAENSLKDRVAALRRALLIFHAPEDAVVSVDHAGALYQAARHPKSFIALDGADHLLSKREDADYVAALLAAWCRRYLAVGPLRPELDAP